MVYKDISGNKYGRLTAIRPIDTNGHREWLCKCDCGGEKVSTVQRLNSGRVKSCGCLDRENRIKPKLVKHGMIKTRLYRIWAGIKYRCKDSKSKKAYIYHDKGIRVCKEWEVFEVFRDWAFANGYSDDLTIDRIDGNGNYEPSNCRWVNIRTQNNNRNCNRYETANGETHTLGEWATILNIDYDTLHNKLRCRTLQQYCDELCH